MYIHIGMYGSIHNIHNMHIRNGSAGDPVGITINDKGVHKYLFKS